MVNDYYLIVDPLVNYFPLYHPNATYRDVATKILVCSKNFTRCNNIFFNSTIYKIVIEEKSRIPQLPQQFGQDILLNKQPYNALIFLQE